MVSLLRHIRNGLKWLLFGKMRFPGQEWEQCFRLPKVTGLSMRRYAETDFETCLKIYQANAPGRFPPDVEADYMKTLRTPEQDLFVVEQDGRVIATCLISAKTPDLYSFGYGLVDPAFQNKGIGTLLFFARLALLPRPSKFCLVWISAVAASMPFYERFGFVKSDVWKDDSGQVHPIGSLWVSAAMIQASRDFIRRIEISLPPPSRLHFDPNPPQRLEWDAKGRPIIVPNLPDASKSSE
jgi:RimJ/RimL family protein N-acetyltransferase